jgi:hypothetical protein
VLPFKNGLRALRSPTAATDVEETEGRQIVVDLCDVGGGVVEMQGQPNGCVVEGLGVWGLGFRVEGFGLEV